MTGAGAFGAWSALELQRRAGAVTLIDAWGPGNVRASSGGETRVIRATYGTREHYTRLALRALERWRAFEVETGCRLLHETGVLWLFGGSQDAQTFARASLDALRRHGAACDEIDRREAATRFPQIAFDDVASVMFEREAGYLMARRACEQVVERLEREGGVFRLGAAAVPVDVDALRRHRLVLADGTAIEADIFVFASGPWLGSLFPDVIGRRVIATRQEVYYFGTPAGDPRFVDPAMPVWIELGAAEVYGIPGNANRGFKVADDTTGPEMDPTTSDRKATKTGVDAARAFLARRFPALAGAPLVDAEVCQYEASPDSDLIIDRHPEAGHVWLVGGGSGHGYKMGPVIGELVAKLVRDEAPIDARFALARFDAAPAAGWQPKWT